MGSNWRQFADALRKVAVTYPEQVYMPKLRRFAFKIVAIAAELSPVNYGPLRNGWHVSLGSPSKTDKKVASGRGGLAQVMRTAEQDINPVRMGETIWIQNNTPHAVDYGFGTFTPANPGPSSGSHAPPEWRSEKEGKILISGGFNVTAPRGMLGDAAIIAYGLAASGRL